MRIVDGAIAGATGAVSMMIARPAIERARLGPRDQASEWERVFRVQARRAGYRPSRTAVRIGGSAAHLVYGASLGALLAMLAGSRRVKPAVAGVPYGLVVWYANYAKHGLVAMLGALPPRRKTIPVAHHLVFGIVTAAVYSWLVDRRNASSPNARAS